jgi:nucleotide-binding universal stress UspA family protein
VSDPAVVDQAEKRLKELQRRLPDGVKARVIVGFGSPAPAIIETAHRENATMILLGAYGKGFLDRFTMGSTSSKVLQQSDLPVMIMECRLLKDEGTYSCEQTCVEPLAHVVAATDFSDYFSSLKPQLEDLVRDVNAPMTLVHVQTGKNTMGWQAGTEALEGQATENMRRLRELGECLAESCPEIGMEILEGDPAVRIMQVAKETGASLIVVGAFGSSEFLGRKLGGVTEKIVRESEVPVLVLKAA